MSFRVDNDGVIKDAQMNINGEIVNLNLLFNDFYPSVGIRRIIDDQTMEYLFGGGYTCENDKFNVNVDSDVNYYDGKDVTLVFDRVS